MSLDYDLVIIGNTPEAFFAASEAIKFNARVALVLGESTDYHCLETDSLIFNYLTYLHRHWHNLNQWNLELNSVSPLNYYQAEQWKNEVKQGIKELNYLEKLANLGVDIIAEPGEFCRLPKLGFVLKNRTLRSRRYLLAMNSIAIIPKIPGVAAVGYIIPETLDVDKLPQQIVIVSQTSLGIELAQQLNRLGKEITLIVETSNILPQEDKDIVQLIQAILEAEGINLFINSPITQVRRIEGKKWIQAGNEAIETDEIIMINQRRLNTKELNLEGVKVEIENNKIKTNHKLQTTNPKIYACGNRIGTYNLSNLAKYEVSIAVKNTIFYPFLKVNYDHHPVRILINPIFSKVGLTETQAKEKYENDLIIIKQNYKTLVKARILDETTGFCKLITRRNGLILGCQIIGNDSDEIINIIALAIKNKIKIHHISKVFPPQGTTAEILFQIAKQWQEQKNRENNLLNNCLETLLFWRRKWSK
ncbi:probable pyridine nucleotide-disulfide oxidoreductase [Crocosphaera subtropica ATCC 51142]|uniref:Probable pyridine nucleotide-disulfide oxidoreductase n=1 Tax=Crocosphaera subtropica (strain ATCC 51142 / BH68) TaxID=43989 RepID=B1WXJ9_CROS5|nr:NAD(P)/FAD-dependent oxidoreductase [Crocosphaera subtropica]ACB52540.1 probable pyridine nucleotide-disulfide oxidoreductase [Crocosphaera subtropica ATCC 51142]